MASCIIRVYTSSCLFCGFWVQMMCYLYKYCVLQISLGFLEGKKNKKKEIFINLINLFVTYKDKY